MGVDNKKLYGHYYYNIIIIIIYNNNTNVTIQYYFYLRYDMTSVTGVLTAYSACVYKTLIQLYRLPTHKLSHNIKVKHLINQYTFNNI